MSHLPWDGGSGSQLVEKDPNGTYPLNRSKENILKLPCRSHVILRKVREKHVERKKRKSVLFKFPTEHSIGFHHDRRSKRCPIVPEILIGGR